MYRIWFNHWFSSVYRIVELIRKEYGKKCYILGTNDKEFCVYKEVCDEFEQEPIFKNEDDYVDWALSYCKEHNVNIFFPRRNMVAIARRVSEFKDLDVKVVLSSDYETMELFNDKAKTYFEMNFNQLTKVPQIQVVNNVNDFIEAYKIIKTIYPEERVIFKYSCGEGATSFRVIDDKVADISVLDTGAGLKMTYEDAVKLLGSVDTFPDLMVMPYLKGPEISVDCIKLEDGLISICRNKIGSRVTEVYYDEELNKIANAIADKYNLYGPFNVQFRYHDNELYLLELNTRMSGGIHLSCLTGANLPVLAIEKILGNSPKMPNYNKETFKVSQIETPIIVG